MAGFKMRRAQQAKIEEVGEETIFATYIELRSVRMLLEAIGLPNAHQALYSWLHEEGRWPRWQDVRRIVADRAVDNIVETVESVTPENAAASRVKLDGEKWLAAMHNRQAYGSTREASALVVGTPEMWLEAMLNSTVLPPNPHEIVGEPESED